MLYFKELVSSVRHKGMLASTGTKSLEEAQEIKRLWQSDREAHGPSLKEFYEAVESARLFVFESEPNKHVEAQNLEAVERVDLPFEVCAFEYFGGGTYKVRPDGTPEEDPLLCVLIHEVEPRKYRFWAYGMMDGEKQVLLSEPEDLENHLPILAHVNNFLALIPKSKIGLEQVRERIKLGSGKSKRVHEIRQIIRIVRKKDMAAVRSLAGAEIDWSHRWEVRGHWREITGLGKNRDGEYCVKGMTWVRNHEKGPADVPLVRKPRFIAGSPNAGIAR